jgi:hypothetical protein
MSFFLNTKALLYTFIHGLYATKSPFVMTTSRDLLDAQAKSRAKQIGIFREMRWTNIAAMIICQIACVCG